jgi:hypothetical protein
VATDDFAAQLDRAVAVADSHRADLAGLPGVIAVGAGPKRKRGNPTGDAAVVVTVREKLSRTELRARGIAALPRSVGGVPVDVVTLEPDQALADALAAAIAAKESVAADWLGTDNVTAIGVGYKERRGRATERLAVQIGVVEKLSPAEVERRGLPLVPAEIDGIPTDVIVVPRYTVHTPASGSRSDRKDPLVGGLSIGIASDPFHYGTLGAIAFDASNAAVGLSNAHVLDGDIGETVHQPGTVGLDDSFDVDFQLDVCVPVNFVRIDTPDTTGGSILAGAAVACAIAAAASDDIDPTRRGQEMTAPSPGALTLEEYTKVKVSYTDFPRPGTPFKLSAEWNYQRRTTDGDLDHVEEVDRTNPHVLRYHRLFVDREHYGTEDAVNLLGVVLAPPRRRRPCSSYYCVAILQPLDRDESHPVVLRPLAEAVEVANTRSLVARPTTGQITREEVLRFLFEQDLSDAEAKLLKSSSEQLCLYFGRFHTAGRPVGRWRHWMHVQTVNDVPPGTDPLKAAQIIGGLPLSNHYRADVDVACGPFVFEDNGSFDIEPL